MGDIIIALLSGLIGAILASIISYGCGIKLLKKDFELRNKKEYIEKLISWASLEYNNVEEELEKIKETEWGKELSKIEKIHEEKLIEIKEKSDKFLIQEDLSLLYLKNSLLTKALIDFQRKEKEIMEILIDSLKNKKKNIQIIEQKLSELKDKKLKIIVITREELK